MLFRRQVIQLPCLDLIFSCKKKKKKDKKDKKDKLPVLAPSSKISFRCYMVTLQDASSIAFDITKEKDDSGA
ncbi:hypothetical protein ACSS6W_001149 [Trichoderma asperelloides]